MSYFRCECSKCGSQFATVLSTDEALMSEPCPKCGEKMLKITGEMSLAETKGLFSGGG